MWALSVILLLSLSPAVLSQTDGASCGGFEGAGCCEDASCASGLVCTVVAPNEVTVVVTGDNTQAGGSCEACGGEGQVACVDGAPCQEGLLSEGCNTLTSAARCVANAGCGGEGLPCCTSGVQCEAPLQCRDDGIGNQPIFTATDETYTCQKCGGVDEVLCNGPQQCDEGLTPALYGSGTLGDPLAAEVLRTEGPVFGCADLPCGSEQGVACCTDGPACAPTSFAEFNSFPLTCVEGTCVSCGVDGAVPCPDSGCDEGLEDTRGFCRPVGLPLCGQVGEPCCEESTLFAATEACETGGTCNVEAIVEPGAQGPSGFNRTCVPCGGDGLPACSVRALPERVFPGFSRQLCNDGLALVASQAERERGDPDLIRFGSELFCTSATESCGRLNEPACPEDFRCPCQLGLSDMGGTCQGAALAGPPSDGGSPPAEAPQPEPAPTPTPAPGTPPSTLTPPSPPSSMPTMPSTPDAPEPSGMPPAAEELDMPDDAGEPDMVDFMDMPDYPGMGAGGYGYGDQV